VWGFTEDVFLDDEDIELGYFALDVPTPYVPIAITDNDLRMVGPMVAPAPDGFVVVYYSDEVSVIEETDDYVVGEDEATLYASAVSTPGMAVEEPVELGRMVGRRRFDRVSGETDVIVGFQFVELVSDGTGYGMFYRYWDDSTPGTYLMRIGCVD
jgi:hypothetical protein